MSAEVGRYFGLDGVWLKNAETRLFIQSFGGMTPEFAILATLDSETHWVNSHWTPHFRALFSGGMDSNDPEQADYWGIELMRQVAGTFPCAPTFGPGNAQLLPHGDTANSVWVLDGVDERTNDDQSISCACWHLNGQYQGLTYRKWDCLGAEGSTHFMILEVSNPNAHEVPINLAWHTTLGRPFLERGCKISNNCDRFRVAPMGTEFDLTSGLVAGAEFDSLEKAPGKDKSLRDLSSMPGYNGHSEFISGVRADNDILWSVCVNPFMKLAYLSIIPLNVLADQVNASSLNYWVHAGGRNFTPWADYQGGVDRDYALGMESAIGSSCLGLDWAQDNPTFMDKPSYVVLTTGRSVKFPCINSIFTVEYDEQRPLNAVSIQKQVEKHIKALDFSVLKRLTGR